MLFRSNSHVALVAPFSVMDACSRRTVLTPLAPMPLQPRLSLEALPTGRATEVAGHAIVDLLVVVEDAGQAEGLAAGEADVLLLLRVDARVVAQRHGVGEGLRAHGAAEVAGLVSVLVVQKAPRVAVATVAYVAREWALLFFHGHVRLAVAAAAGVDGQLVGSGEGLPAFLALEVFCPPASPPPRPSRHVLFEVRAGVVRELSLYPEAFPTVLAAVLL